MSKCVHDRLKKPCPEGKKPLGDLLQPGNWRQHRDDPARSQLWRGAPWPGFWQWQPHRRGCFGSHCRWCKRRWRYGFDMATRLKNHETRCTVRSLSACKQCCLSLNLQNCVRKKQNFTVWAQFSTDDVVCSNSVCNHKNKLVLGKRTFSEDQKRGLPSWDVNRKAAGDELYNIKKMWW